MEFSEVMKMDIFFFVTTFVVAFLGLLSGIALLFFIKILADLRAITKTVREEAKEIAEDFGIVRAEIKEGVHEVRETVGQTLGTAKAYGKAFAGAGIVRALSTIFEAFAAEKERSTKRTRKTKRDD